MEKEKPKPKSDRQTQPPLKPKHPHMEGAPSDQDPEAQYEDKDES